MAEVAGINCGPVANAVAPPKECAFGKWLAIVSASYLGDYRDVCQISDACKEALAGVDGKEAVKGEEEVG
jgi:hypothetical protein